MCQFTKTAQCPSDDCEGDVTIALTDFIIITYIMSNNYMVESMNLMYGMDYQQGFFNM